MKFIKLIIFASDQIKSFKNFQKFEINSEGNFESFFTI